MALGSDIMRMVRIIKSEWDDVDNAIKAIAMVKQAEHYKVYRVGLNSFIFKRIS
jgi:hypothetical protein